MTRKSTKDAVKETLKIVQENVEQVVEVLGDITKETVDAAQETADRISKTAKASAGKMKVNTFIQYAGKEVCEAYIVEAIKAEYAAKEENAEPIKTLDLYVKPEDEAVYYVINGDYVGKMSL